MNTKEVLLELAKTLPEDSTVQDAIDKLQFFQTVEEGLASLNAGKRIPLEVARKRISDLCPKFD